MQAQSPEAATSSRPHPLHDPGSPPTPSKDPPPTPNYELSAETLPLRSPELSAGTPKYTSNGQCPGTPISKGRTPGEPAQPSAQPASPVSADGAAPPASPANTEVLSALADYKSPPHVQSPAVAVKQPVTPASHVKAEAEDSQLLQDISKESEKAKRMAAATDPLTQCWYYLDPMVYLSPLTMHGSR